MYRLGQCGLETLEPFRNCMLSGPVIRLAPLTSAVLASSELVFVLDATVRIIVVVLRTCDWTCVAFVRVLQPCQRSFLPQELCLIKKLGFESTVSLYLACEKI